MKVTMTEYRDGQWYEDGAWRSYPPVGDVLDTNPVHAADLCAQGYAKPVTETRKAETPEDTLAASEETRGTSPAQNEPKSAWVAHAVSQGAASTDAEAMTKQALIEHYGA